MLGTMVGLGADLDLIRKSLASLDVDGWKIAESIVTRCSLSSTRVKVVTTDASHHRAWSTIDLLIANSGLSDFVRDGARRTFRRLGEVEANQHGTTIDEVHFHEVGAIDAVVDVVGSWVALELLEVAEVHVGPVGLGHGTIKAAHGILPLPAPATVALLEGITVKGLQFEGETATPTGAALVATMATHFGQMPQGTVVNSARGAGGRNPKNYPNVTSGLIIDLAHEPLPAGSEELQAVAAFELATNLDDVTPEVLGYVIDQLLDAGADDAWAVPIQMKKNRPGQQLRVLCSPKLAPLLRQLISSETGTLGIRQFVTTKYVQPRQTTTVQLHGFDVRIKIGPHGAKPEHDDLVKVAAKVRLPLRQLAAEALQVAAAG